VGQRLTLAALAPLREVDQPPPRFTEASLVQALEARGLGRPSTFAAIVDTVQARGYVEREARRLVPTALGVRVTDALAEALPRELDVAFTAGLEAELDLVEEGCRLAGGAGGVHRRSGRAGAGRGRGGVTGRLPRGWPLGARRVWPRFGRLLLPGLREAHGRALGPAGRALLLRRRCRGPSRAAILGSSPCGGKVVRLADRARAPAGRVGSAQAGRSSTAARVAGLRPVSWERPAGALPGLRGPWLVEVVSRRVGPAHLPEKNCGYRRASVGPPERLRLTLQGVL
jgi:hypothetical protein